MIGVNRYTGQIILDGGTIHGDVTVVLACDYDDLHKHLVVAEQRVALLSKALEDIRVNSDDPGACECATEALAASNDPTCKCPLTTDRHLLQKCKNCNRDINK